MSDSGDLRASQPHVALLPSSGMGHLTPFLRLAASLASLNCRVTFITTHPTVSLAESQLVHRFLSAFPQVIPIEFHLLPFDPSIANSNDPFFLQFEAIRRSVHLLSPLLSSLSPPLSALITDVSLASEVIPVTNNLSLPNYILFTSSAKMLSFCAHFPTIVNPNFNPNSSKDEDSINISDDLPPIPKSSIPPLLLNLTNLFTTQFISNGLKLVKSNGILINTFDSLEREWLTALNAGKVVKGLPPVITIGPLVPCNFEGGSPVAWLDNQPVGSVAYVSFGSRTTMSREQIRELGEGLEKSGCRFLWVVKDKKIDREDVERVEDVVGNGFTERVKDKGLVVKNWVNQSEILSHKSVGGFVSHCGWNSVVEAALHGVRMLAWPQGGDQRINAGVVERSGLGLWIKSWGWGGGSEVVKAEEIGERVKEMMGDERLRMKAAHVREEAMKAVDAGGSSETGLSGVINMWKNTAAIM